VCISINFWALADQCGTQQTADNILTVISQAQRNLFKNSRWRACGGTAQLFIQKFIRNKGDNS
jgi:hypothetical protein